jgi:ubiquitin-activating enzyme E1
VTVLEETRHNLQSGDVVMLTQIIGFEQLNNREFTVNVKDFYSFEITLTPDMLSTPSRYVRGGYINQVKQAVTVSFASMASTINNPGEICCDVVKSGDRALAVHLAFRALHEYVISRQQNTSDNGKSSSLVQFIPSDLLPQPGNTNDAEEIFNIAVMINNNMQSQKVDDLEPYKDVIQKFALSAKGQISPVCTLLGGIVAQEVLKACSGKFMPIRQWFYFDAIETLPDVPLPIEEVAPLGCRYDSQIAVFGRSMQHRLSQLNLFLVGAGAIGCEMIKVWAMMGMCSTGLNGERSGVAHVTDMDLIEKSNLSRQFLFRNKDINNPKSLTAVKAAMHMNPHFQANSYELKVAPESETVFNDDFYDSLDFVWTALDNVEARLYVDQRCMFYHVPMLESGTLGTKGHTQVVVPNITENYGATRDPPEKSIPTCTLKHFPNLIEHTLQWAREFFEETYKQTAEDCNNYIKSETVADFQRNYLANQQNLKIDTLQRMLDALTNYKPNNIQDCLVWARLLFEDLFVNKIKQLLHLYPVDRVTSTGTPFWYEYMLCTPN